MSKFVKIPNGDYKLSVQPGGTITLDAGGSGNIVVDGNLVIGGSTTTISTEDLAISDNIIVLNDGEQGAGVSLNQSGIQIDRGSEPHSFFIFDEQMSWTDPTTGATRNGGFVFTDDIFQPGSLIGIRTNSITTAGSNLFIEPGGAVVALPDNYEQRINALGALDVDKDRVVPNVGWVEQELDSLYNTIITSGISQISQGTTTPSRVTVIDQESSGTASLIEFALDNTIISRMFDSSWTYNDLRFSGSTIVCTQDGADLTLRADGFGSVRVDDVLRITERSPSQINAELAPSTGIKIYSAPPQAGKTGLYYINAENDRDEFASKKRSLFFSMLF